MRVTIMMGLPGSGKTAWVQKNFSGPEVLVVSATSFFEQGGAYSYDPKQVPKAHSECLFSFTEALLHPPKDLKHIIVDNTNLSLWAIAPYASLARAYGAELEMVLMDVKDLRVLEKRNVHGVTLNKLRRLAQELDGLARGPWPSNWPRPRFIREDWFGR